MQNPPVSPVRAISRSIILIVFAFVSFLFPVKAAKDFDVSMLNHSKETDHFIIHYNDKDSSCIYDILSRLEEKYPKICSDLGYKTITKFDIMVYPDLKTFHSAIFHPEYLDWIINLTNTDKVYMESPLNPGPNYPYEAVPLAAVNGFTQALIWRIPKTGDIPGWLSEGIASLEAEQTFYKIDVLWKNQAIPTFADLETRLGTLGYKWSYSIAEFAVKTYGIKKLPFWIKNGGDIQKTFGISKERFWKKWADSIPKI